MEKTERTPMEQTVDKLADATRQGIADAERATQPPPAASEGFDPKPLFAELRRLDLENGRGMLR